MDNSYNFSDLEDLVPTFNNFSDCTEYFYNEIGKLDDVPVLLPKEKKKLKKVVMNLFYKHIGLIKMKDNVQQKKEIASVNKTLSDLRNIKKNAKKLASYKSHVKLPPPENDDKKLLADADFYENE